MLLLARPALAHNVGEDYTILILLSSLLVIGLLFIPMLANRLIVLKQRAPQRCPYCCRNDVRPSGSHWWRSQLASIFGLASYRCRSCRHSYSAPRLENAVAAPSRQRVRRRRTAPPMQNSSEVSPGVVPDLVPEIAPDVVSDAVPDVVPELAPGPTKGIRKKRRNHRPKGGNRMIAAGTVAALAIPVVVWFRGSETQVANRTVANRTVAAIHDSIPRMESPSPSDKSAPSRQYDLVVSEAFFVPAGNGRRLRGVVRNNGKLPYHKVEILFGTDDRDYKAVRDVTIKIPRLLPGESVTFETESVPPKATRHHIKSIDGTRVDISAAIAR